MMDQTAGDIRRHTHTCIHTHTHMEDKENFQEEDKVVGYFKTAPSNIDVLVLLHGNHNSQATKSDPSHSRSSQIGNLDSEISAQGHFNQITIPILLIIH